MKTRFEIPFRCKSVVFEGPQELKTRAKVDLIPRDKDSGVEQRHHELSVLFQIIPSEGHEPNRFTDGKMLITVPGEPDEFKFLVKKLAYEFADHLEFFYGRFKIQGELLIAERIPESKEEAEQVGDKPYWIEASLEEVPPPEKFDSKVLKLFPSAVFTPLQRTLHQFNTAVRAKSPVDKFLGLYKVIEVQYHIGKKHACEALQQNKEFRSLVLEEIKMNEGETSRLLTNEEFNELVEKLVNIRDSCAHLKEKFGYAPGDAEVGEIVVPYAGMIEKLAWATIRETFRKKAPEVSEGVFGDLKHRLNVKP